MHKKTNRNTPAAANRAGGLAAALAHWALPALLALQVLFLAYLLLRAGARTVDVDAANVYTHTREMWRQGTVFLKDWRYVTTVELDCATLLALPLYGLLGNISLAFQIADILLLGCLLLLVFALLDRLGASRNTACLAGLLVIAPYDFAQLSYCNMLYANAAQYSVKVFLPLLLVYLLLGRPGGLRRAGDWVLAAVYLSLTLCTGFSSGYYVAACGLAPVLAVEFWKWLRQEHELDAYRGLLFFGSVATTLAGRLLTALAGIEISGLNMQLVTLDTLHRNFVSCLMGIFQVFYGIAYDPTNALSINGIHVLVMGGFTFLLLGAGLVGLHHLPAGREGAAAWLPAGAAYLLAIPFWNLAVLLVCDTAYGSDTYEFRYHLMGIIPLMLVLALLLSNLPRLCPARFRRGMLGAAALFLGAVFLVANTATYQKIRRYSTGTGIINQQYALCDYLNTLGVDNAYFVNDSISSGQCRAIDDSARNYVAYDSGENTLYLYDYYLAATDAATATGSSALITGTGAGTAFLPAYLQNSYTLAGTVAGFDVYTSDTTLLDGPAGLPFGVFAVDYCDSRGFTVQGSMDNARTLHTEGNTNIVVENQALPLCRPVNITLNYAVETAGENGTAGTLEVWQNEQLLQSAELTVAESAVTLAGVDGGGEPVTLRVRLNSGAAALLKTITYQAVS